MKFLDLVFDLSAYFFRRGREINTGDKSINAGTAKIVGGNIFATSGLAVGSGNITPPTKTIVMTVTTAPGTPAAGFIYIYTKSSDGRLYYKNSTGTEYGPL